jgi:hypothetical protein
VRRPGQTLNLINRVNLNNNETGDNRRFFATGGA